MAYLVLARKYRPSTLAELVGQEHIARALSNALAMNRIPHALLFCGARGTGKTSTARIVAKMLNCVQGPTSTPCGQCSPCREIASSTSIDVLELDAASNRGIDEIRELRSGVGYAPSRDRFKVYIVDEAHMLTDQAANAFLKTLEEPPPHVVFVLATTDPQRLPVTIRSRCQRYDFRRVKAGDVVQSLQRICTSEGIAADKDALYLVAREGDGSMRDSLSVLDQVIAFGGTQLDADGVAALLGVADRHRVHKLVQSLLGRDAAGALQAVAAAHDHGMDLRTFARTLAMETRDLLVTRLAGTAAKDLVDRSESEIETLQKLGEGTPTAELERLAHVMLELAEQVARARHPRLVMEMGMVRLCRAASLVDVAELAVRVEGLLAGGRLPGGSGKPGGSQGSSSPAGFGSSGPGTPPRPLSSGSLSQPLVPHRPAPPPPVAPPPRPVEREARADAVPPPTKPLTDADLAKWQAAIRGQLGRPIEASLLDNAVVHGCSGRHVRLAFANEFWAGTAKQGDALRYLQEGAGQAFGGQWTVEIAGVDARARSESLAAQRMRAKTDQRTSLEADLRHDRRVLALVEAVGGQIVQIHPAGDDPGGR